MRISDWSSDVCSSDLRLQVGIAQRISRRRMGEAVVDLAPACVVEAQSRFGHAREFADQPLALIGSRRLERHVEHCEPIGRASCRERVCQYVVISLVAVSLKKKQ